MIIKEAVYKEIKVIQNKCVSDSVYGCDECKTPIKEYPNEEQRLEATVFYNDDKTEHLHFCSWDCVLKHLPKIKTDYFISLPFIYFDGVKTNKRGAQHLMKLLKNLQK